MRHSVDYEVNKRRASSDLRMTVSSSCRSQSQLCIVNVKGYEALLLFCSYALGGGLVSERSQSTKRNLLKTIIFDCRLRPHRASEVICDQIVEISEFFR